MTIYQFMEPTALQTEPRVATTSRRRGDSRRRLLAAARRLFVERGYHETRPQDIARAADLGHGTFYLHFADKRACFFAFVDEARSELQAEIDRRMAAEPDLGGLIRAILEASWDYGERNPGVIRAALTDVSVIAKDPDAPTSLMRLWGDHWGQLLAKGIESGRVHAGYDPAIIGHAIIGFIVNAATQTVSNQQSRHQVIDNLTTFLTRALAPDQATTGSNP